ncbi:MAG: cation:proton antiporter [Candidatus Eisenbacteria bacterium]|uniref:Cation:proton antiporter n=1 Tax=Eiseniibacteriota bacterium TaxID=2212470 RepID=A0A956LYA9_UNCEI|nr:cation:proton antiporter [Candidatus Eisenbacteria bacterium]
MHGATTIILIASAAFFLPLLAGRLRVPAVVLEILFGIVVGPVGFGFIEQSELLDFLAEFGFFLLMFLSGFEIDFGKLGRQGPGQIFIALAIFASTLVLAYFAAHRLGYGPFVTLLLATTSMGLVVPTLRGSRRAQTRLGQAILMSAVLADFLTLLGVTVVALGFEHGVGWQLLKVPALFLIITIFLVALRQAAWWFPERFERLFSPHDPEELGIRASLAMMFIFVGLSLALDVEPILGAFLAGTVFALVFRHRGSLERELSGFSYGFLIPVFFINVGVSFQASALLEPGALKRAGALILAALAVKLIPSMLLLLQRIRFRQALAAGILLSARLSLVIAVASLGVRIGVLNAEVQASVILLAAVTATFAPTLFRLLVPPLPAPDTKTDP